VGKLIVAVTTEEVERLHALYKRGVENGVPMLTLMDQQQLQQVEPHCVGLAAIHCGFTGIVDYAQVHKLHTLIRNAHWQTLVSTCSCFVSYNLCQFFRISIVRILRDEVNLITTTHAT
jgi:L-2-hydroxyglutarate oxidase LhgO